MPVPKIPVQQLVFDGYTTRTTHKPCQSYSIPNYSVRFPDESDLTPLRYAIDELIAENPSYKGKFDTTGYLWKVSDDFFLLFKNWLILPDELHNMREQARDESRRQESEKQEQLENARLDRIVSRKQYRVECQYKRLPCASPCKIPVIKITCLREESHHEDDIRYHFAVELDQGSTKQQKAARLQLAKALASDQSTGLFYRGDNIKGRGCNWILHEFVVLAYSEWLELDEPIETVLAFEIEKFKQEELRKAEESARVERERKEEQERRQREFEERIRRSYERAYRSNLPTDSQVATALLIFNLDDSATEEDVRKQYRTLAKQCHPDTGGDAEKFKQLNNANQVLMQYFA